MYPTRQCIANRQGDVSIVSISRAITIGTPQEDVALSKFTSSDNENESFLIIPLTSGVIKVHFVQASSLEDYVISEVEVNASLGYPLPYLVDKVFKDGTTAQFNIGY